MLLAACGGSDEGAETGADEGTEPDTEETDGDNVEDSDGEDGDSAATGEPVEGGEIIVGSDAEPNGLTPATVSDTASRDAHDLVHAALYRQTVEGFDVEPDVAVDLPEVSEDGLEQVIQLRDDVFFSDGEQVTADDVVFTVGIYLMEDYAGTSTTLFERVEDVEATDEYEVTFTMSEPDAALTANLEQAPIVPEHILGDLETYAEIEEHEASTTDAVIGAGPYVMTDWTVGQYINYEARDDYHNEGPYIQNITWRIGDTDAQLAMLQAGEIDIMNAAPQDVVTVEAIDGYNLAEEPQFGYNYIGYNQRNELFESANVRRALTMAIDREAIIEGIMDGHGTVAEFPHSQKVPIYSDEIESIPFDQEGALELLAEEGWEQNDSGQLANGDGEVFAFSLLTNSEALVRTDWIVAVQQMLGEIGIEVETETMEFGAYLDRINPPNWDFDAIAGAWSLSLDPNMESLFHSSNIESGQNNIAYESEEFDELATDNRAILDVDERMETLQQAAMQVAEDQVYTFMYYPTEFQAYRDNIQNHSYNSRAGLFRVQEWWIEE
ncbi:LOW QUALITY PROTEIN: oligopeptide ABC transporter, periplasmic oligopeptide-binding protein OppA [Geomicrobium sp. JCM 19038]|nr:LOW QUALITY PROTEIN: oligopeptide ABC transporter, periplasmic oligopeptide-binding protein OppA [Geomicrobium sp. JCM 19038]